MRSTAPPGMRVSYQRNTSRECRFVAGSGVVLVRLSGPDPGPGGPKLSRGGRLMRYMLLINSDRNAPPPQKSEMEAIMQGHQRFGEELLAAKKMVHGERLRSDDEASRIRLKAGQRQVTDGPFTETKKVLGGFYLIECDSKSEAIEWAKKIPLREGGYVEVVPIWPM